MDYQQKLQTLTEHSGTIQDFNLEKDNDALKLPKNRQDAWKKLLSSILSAESAEGKVMEPVHLAFSSLPIIQKYLVSHGNDEAKHAFWIKSYLSKSFHFEKKKKTIGSKIIYDTALPFISTIVSKSKPVLILILVYFYEIYSQFIYQAAKKAALTDQLMGLVKLIEQIEKDELRHLVGIETITKYYHKEIHPFTNTDKWLAKLALQVTKLDLAQAPWAIHNRHLAEQVEVLGISSKAWHQMGNEAENKCLQLLRQR